ncbi:MAG: transposase [Acidobacteria bacterium]|nr:transposase [Acidobacteriota bacterium]
MQRGDSWISLGDSPQAWRSRGYLPHFDSERVVQHVTFHLADSLPADALARLNVEVATNASASRDTERRQRIDDWIDAGHGNCLLRAPRAAQLVQDALLFFDGERYTLYAWVVMPNHVHALFQTTARWELARIVGSWKSFTGRRLAKFPEALAGPVASGPVWHRDYWDRFIRDEQHFHAVRRYIHDNPVKAGLVSRPEDWNWSSARLSSDSRAV